jgi:cell shape-determining protein MreC
VTQAVASTRSNVSLYQQQLIQQRAELSQYEARVDAFMMNNKMAVACIVAGFGGAGVLLDDSNQFTQEAKDIAAVVTVIAGIYALMYPEEIAFVGDQLMQANANYKTMERNIASTNQYLQAQLSQLQQEEQQLASLDQQSESIRSQLMALN